MINRLSYLVQLSIHSTRALFENVISMLWL